MSGDIAANWYSTDTHLVAAVEAFNWPCDKRIAHGPHEIEDFAVYGFKFYPCPGVLAHPAVMIGRTVAQP